MTAARPNPARFLLAVSSLVATSTMVAGVRAAEELKPLLTLSDAGNIVAFNSAGTTLVTLAGNLWEVATGRRIRAIGGINTGLSDLVFSPDDKTLAVRHILFEGIDLHDFTVGRQRTLRGPIDHATQSDTPSIAFPADGQTLIAIAIEEVRLFDLATLRQRAAYTQADAQFGVLALSPDRKTAAVACDDSLQVVQRVVQPRPGGDKGFIVVLDMDRAQPRAKLRQPVEPHGVIRLLTYAPDVGALVAGTEDGTIWQWKMASGRARRLWSAGGDVLRALGYSAAGKLLAVVERDAGELGICDPNLGQTLATIRADSFPANTGGDQESLSAAHVACVVISPDGQTLATVGRHSKIMLWDLRQVGQ